MAMKLLILGGGKTGSLVAEVARARRHSVEVLRAADNPGARALTHDKLGDFDQVIDFTTPQAALENIEACLAAGKSMVVGTTGWYDHLPRIRERVEHTAAGFLYGANFSVGVNVFYDVVEAASEAIARGYSGQILERHHAHKKDAPSGTAAVLQDIIRRRSGANLAISSLRQGELVGTHEVVLESLHDAIRLCHEAKSRRGFADGAVRAAEWLGRRPGFFNFQDIWRELVFGPEKIDV
jgi:4-hydroxy-tetrahydrodipicolinate reductase